MDYNKIKIVSENVIQTHLIFEAIVVYQLQGEDNVKVFYETADSDDDAWNKIKKFKDELQKSQNALDLDKKIIEDDEEDSEEDIEQTKNFKNIPSILKWALALFAIQFFSSAGSNIEVYLNEGYEITAATTYSIATAIGSNIFLIIGVFLCYKYYKEN